MWVVYEIIFLAGREKMNDGQAKIKGHEAGEDRGQDNSCFDRDSLCQGLNSGVDNFNQQNHHHTKYHGCQKANSTLYVEAEIGVIPPSLVK